MKQKQLYKKIVLLLSIVNDLRLLCQVLLKYDRPSLNPLKLCEKFFMVKQLFNVTLSFTSSALASSHS